MTTHHAIDHEHHVVDLLPVDPSHPTMANTFRTQPFHAGDYLTDRQRLYRVVEIVPARFRKRGAILEDCETLDAALFPPNELKRMRLQVVRRTPAASMQ